MNEVEYVESVETKKKRQNVEIQTEGFFADEFQIS